MNIKDFESYKQHEIRLLEEKDELLEYFNDSIDGDCIKLPHLNSFISDSMTEIANYHMEEYWKFGELNVQVKDQSKRDYPIRCSMLADCSKQIILNYHDGQNNYTLKKTPKERHQWCKARDTGTMLHAIIQRELCIIGLVELKDNIKEGSYQEDDLYKLEHLIHDSELCITGHIDFIGNFKKIYDIDKQFVGEIKTTGSMDLGFNIGQRKQYYHKLDKVHKLGHPIVEHLTQGNTYMKCASLDYELFYYLSRATGESCIYMYKRSKKFQDKIIKKIEKINEYHMNNEIPPVGKKTNKMCEYCRYTLICDDIETVDDIKRYL